MIDSPLLSTANPITKRLYQVLKSSPKRIVFTDGEDLRVIEAARQLVDEQLIAPILLGRRDRVQRIADMADVSLKFINVIEPKKASDLPLFIRRLQRVEKFRGRVIANPEEMVCNPHNFAAMMVQYGQADGLVAGNNSMPASIFRSVSQFIKPVGDVPALFSVAVMHAPQLNHVGSEGLLFLADCGMNPEPTVEQLASFGMETGKLATHFIEGKPKVAFLSHSTHGSMQTPSSQRMAAASALAEANVKKASLAMKIVGEVQADVALDPKAAELKIYRQDSATSDVLVFPNLDSAHISFKLLKHVGGAQSYGQLIMGLTKPAAQVAKTTTVETIIGTAALVGVEAIKSRELLFDW